MTRLNAADLPASVRSKLGLDTPKGKAKKGGGTNVHDGWCHACGERIVGCKAWERHSDETGHRRFQCWPSLPLVEDDPPSSVRSVP